MNNCINRDILQTKSPWSWDQCSNLKAFSYPLETKKKPQKKCHIIYISPWNAQTNIIQKSSSPPRKALTHPPVPKKNEFGVQVVVPPLFIGVSEAKNFASLAFFPTSVPAATASRNMSPVLSWGISKVLKKNNEFEMKNAWNFQNLISPDIQIFEKKTAKQLNYLQSSQKDVGWKRWRGGWWILITWCFFCNEILNEFGWNGSCWSYEIPVAIGSHQKEHRTKMYVSTRRHLHMANVPLLW